MSLPTVEDLAPHLTRLLVRVDLNVPVADGRVTDTFRVEAVAPDLVELAASGRALILLAHLGRPEGVDASLSLAPILPVLEKLLHRSVRFIGELPSSPAWRASAGRVGPGEVALSENLRFHPGERVADPSFARDLASVAEGFVEDAFGVLHRRAASTVLLPTLLPAAAGRLVVREAHALDAVGEGTDHPFVVVVGGAKISDKLALIDRLAQAADVVLLGGGLANTFFLAEGLEIGRSLAEPECGDAARALLNRHGGRIRLPASVVVQGRSGAIRETPPDGVRADEAILDVAPQAVAAWAAVIEGAARLFWNGPMGLAEDPDFARGTREMARAVARCPGFTVVGGGDSVAALRKLDMAGRVRHLSTGGGASLAFLEGRELPGLAALGREVAR